MNLEMSVSVVRLISLIIPDEINLTFRSRSNDDVVVKDGIVSGTLDKRAIGAEDGRLLDAIIELVLQEEQSSLTTLPNGTIGACTSLGFTTGIDDEDLTADALAGIEMKVQEQRFVMNWRSSVRTEKDTKLDLEEPQEKPLKRTS